MANESSATVKTERALNSQHRYHMPQQTDFIDLCSSSDDEACAKPAPKQNIRAKRAQEQIFCVRTSWVSNNDSILYDKTYHYGVHSFGSGQDYTVEISRSNRECTCPDWVLRKEQCKHIFYVLFTQGSQSVGDVPWKKGSQNQIFVITF
eukprot:244002_1